MSDTGTRERSGALAGILVGGRIASGLIVTAALAGLVAGAALLPLPTIDGTVRAETVTPAPVAETRVCAGSVLRLGADDGTDATKAYSIGEPELRYTASTGTGERNTLESTEAVNGEPPYRIDLAPAPGAALAASQSQRVTATGPQGFAAAECAKAASDTWLIAGSTTTGRTTLLTLANPSTVESTVTIDLFTENGPVTTTGLDRIIVPVGAQRILSIAGWAPDASSIAVRVRSAGGAVVAHLQHSVTRVLTPGGLDIADPGAGPATTVTIPGFIIDGHRAIEQVGLGGDNHDLAAIVRLLAPGEADASIHMTVRPTPGTAEPVTEDGEQLVAETLIVPIELKAGEVTDIPFDHLLDGSYTITLESSVPIVASARSSRVTGDGQTPGTVDLAWFASATPLAESALVSVAPGPGSVLHLVNPTPHPARVQIEAGTGANSTAEVPAGGAAAVPVTAGGNYSLSGFERLYLAVSYTGQGALASTTVTGPLPIAAAVTVYH